MEKPIFRWTIGTNVLPLGYKILRRSIKEAIRIFRDRFDWYVCYNLEKSQVDCLLRLHDIVEDLPVKLVRQTWRDIPIPEKRPQRRDVDLHLHHTFGGSLWKVCPPRLKLGVHEIVVDNDLIMAGLIDEVEEFLVSDKTLISEDCLRFFGRYSTRHKQGVAYNTGVLGFPPGFDFAEKIHQAWEDAGRLEELTYGDEQGLLSYVLTQEPHIVIPNRTLPILHAGFYYKNNFAVEKDVKDDSKEMYDGYFWDALKDCRGFHFAEANRLGFHAAWKEWARQNIKLL